ncbi:MAG: hypothetical protein LBP59_12310 [Planctomycetaceae bacterium]|nr:hypothetical protein [Planctomycetaceae bacterium]
MVAYRQHAGGTPAIRWSRLLFKIAGISRSQTFRLVFLQIRRRNTCITGSRASRLLFRIADVVTSQPPFGLPCGKVQAGRPRSGGL